MKFVLKANSSAEAVQGCAELIENLAAKHRSVKETCDTKTAAGRSRFASYENEANQMLRMAQVLRSQVEVEPRPEAHVHCWELVPGTGGLIDRCDQCGEERA